MLPFERLRNLVRWSGVDELELAIESGECLADFGDDSAGLVVACRRLVAHHPDAGRLWWLCARVLGAADAREAALESVRLLVDDPTPRSLAGWLPFPHDAPVALVGWTPSIAAAAVGRPDLDLLLVATATEAAVQARRLGRMEQPLEVLSLEGTLRRRPTHVVAEPAAVGSSREPASPPRVLVDRETARALEVLNATGAEVALVVGAGLVLPDRLLSAVEAANPDRLVGYDHAATARVVGPDGLTGWGDRSLEPRCPAAPELLRPF